VKIFPALRSRKKTLGFAVAFALLAVAVAGTLAVRRRAPALPVPDHYSGQPAQFNAALQAARAKVAGGGYDPDDVRELAHLYEANRLNDEASACYGLLRRGQGLTARDHYCLADIAAYQGDLARAEAELREVLAVDPKYIPAHLALGEVLFKSGRPDAAGAEYKAILAIVPDQPQAMFGAARVELLAENDDAAIATLEALLAAHPEMTSGAGLLAQVLDRKGDSARAALMRRWSRQKPEPVPEDPWLDVLLSDSYDIQRLSLKFEEYFASGQISLALPLLKRVEDLDPKSPIPQLLRGWTEARDHNDAGAVKEYTLALEKGADPEKICPYVVQSLLAVGKVREAAALMEEFYAKKPDSIPILLAYSEVAVKEGDKPLARTLLEKVVAREPLLASANMSLASLLWESGDSDGAAACLERAVQVSAGDVASRALLAEYHLGRKDPVPAVPLLEQALALRKGDAAVTENLTHMLLTAYVLAGGAEEEKGRLEDAVTNYYDKAILLVPDNPVAYARKAAACAQLGQFAPAAEALQRLAALQPANPTVFLSLGDVLYKGGNRGLARENWQKALALAAAGSPDLRSAIGQRLNGPITDDTFR
jgi:tetratricopeptide (TPR) repeat protein